jgi:DNA-binding transcriptional ArsR family regulator
LAFVSKTHTFCDIEKRKIPMETGDIQILIKILAETDATFEPVRDETNSRHLAGIWDRRKKYFARGLPIGIGGTELERKQFERHLDALERGGAVKCSRENGRRGFWKLADETEWPVRRLATGSDLPELLVLLLAVQAHQDAGFTNQEFVPEWSLAFGSRVPSGETYVGGILHVQDVAAPGLCRGFLTSCGDFHTHTGYHITTAGRDFLDNPQIPGEWPEWEKCWADSYFGALSTARESVKTITGRDNCLTTRLGCGSWPGDEDRPPIPSVLLRSGKVRSAPSMLRAIAKVKI